MTPPSTWCGADGGRPVCRRRRDVVVSRRPNDWCGRAVDPSIIRAGAAELQVRAGLAYGTVLAPTVTFQPGQPGCAPAAPRARADPGRSATRDMLPDWPASPMAH